MRRRLHACGLALVAFALVAASVTATNEAQDLGEPPPMLPRYAEASKTKIGDKAPDVTFIGADDAQIKLSDYRGRTTVLVLFATWCGPCRDELAHMEPQVWQKFKDREGFAMLVAGRDESFEHVTKFATEQKYTMPFVGDPGRKAFDQFATGWIPRYYLIDEQGVIQYQFAGVHDDNAMQYLIGRLEELLAAQDEQAARP